MVGYASAQSTLIPDHEARGFGLQRSWFSQAQIDASRNRVERVTLEGNQVLVLSTMGTLHAMNAETGATLWITQVGNPDYPSLGPALSGSYAAIINGSTVYVVERETGRPVMNRQLGGGPAAGPSVTNEYVYAPLFSGRVEGFRIDDPKAPQWVYASSGRIYARTMVTADSLVWATERSYLYVADAQAGGVKYRFETSSAVMAPPASGNGQLYAATATGYVYCIDEISGTQKWRYASGAGVTQSPRVVKDRLYVATEAPSLFALDTATGLAQWEALGITQVVAVSPTRVYGIDRLGTLTIMDAATGVIQGRLTTSPDTMAVINDQNDRLYLVSDTGLIQCLHEVGADAPVVHRAPLAKLGDEPAPPTEEDTPPATQPAEEATPGEDLPPTPPADEPPAADPFNDAAPPAEEGDDPFGGDNPFGEEPAEGADNPFGF